MPMKRQFIHVYPRMYTTSRGNEIDPESLKYESHEYCYVVSNIVKKHLSEATTPTSFVLSCTINALPFEEVIIKVGDKLKLNNEEYIVSYVDLSDYRNMHIEAKS